MPTESDLEHLHAFAERYSETVFAEVHNLVKGIALRDVWKNAFGEEVYVDSITFDILYRTALEIFMADCALFAMDVDGNNSITFWYTSIASPVLSNLR